MALESNKNLRYLIGVTKPSNPQARQLDVTVKRSDIMLDKPVRKSLTMTNLLFKLYNPSLILRTSYMKQAKGPSVFYQTGHIQLNETETI